MPKAAPKRPRAGRRPPAKGMRPKITKEFVDKTHQRWLDAKDAFKKMNVHQDPRSKQSARMRHQLANPKRIPKASPHADYMDRVLSPGRLHKLKKGGKVKKK